MTFKQFLFICAAVLCVHWLGLTICYASGPYIYTDNFSVHASGELKFEPGSYITFGDGSIQHTATLVGPAGPSGPSGPPGPAGPPGSAYLSSSDMMYITSTSRSSTDFNSSWFTQGNTWQAFEPSFQIEFTKNLNDSRLYLLWSDTVGIYNSNWCNIGLFVDDAIEPVCSAAWSGVKNTSIFNTEHFHCTVTGISAGVHVLKVKHRSQYCNYGNFAFDDYGLNKKLVVEENISAN